MLKKGIQYGAYVPLKSSFFYGTFTFFHIISFVGPCQVAPVVKNPPGNAGDILWFLQIHCMNMYWAVARQCGQQEFTERAGKSESLPQKPYSFNACWLDNSLATLEQKNRIEFIDFDHYKYLASCVLKKRWNDMKLVNFFITVQFHFSLGFPPFHTIYC